MVMIGRIRSLFTERRLFCTPLLIQLNSEESTLHRTMVVRSTQWLVNCVIVWSLCGFNCASSQLSYTGNIALNKDASEIKTFGGDQTGRFARYAVDGNTDTSNSGNCATSNSNTDYNWWQVDLGNTYVITSITLYIPLTSSDGDVSSSTVYVGNNPNDANQPTCVSFGSPSGIPPGGSQTFNCSQLLVGRFITVRKNALGLQMSICEFEATGNLISTALIGDIALNKPASLLQTFGGPETGRLAKYAVDGNSDTTNNDKCAGGDSPNYNWWQVDLGDTYVITSITLYIPLSSTEGGYSVHYSNIIVSNSPNDTSQPACVSFRESTGIAPGQSGTFNCSSLPVGRYVTIRKIVPNDPLIVCEVIVSGYLLTATTTTTSTQYYQSAMSSSTKATTPVSTTFTQSSGSTSTISSATTQQPGSNDNKKIIVGVILGCVAMAAIVVAAIFISRRCCTHETKTNEAVNDVRSAYEELDLSPTSTKGQQDVIRPDYHNVKSDYETISPVDGDNNTYTSLKQSENQDQYQVIGPEYVNVESSDYEQAIISAADDNNKIYTSLQQSEANENIC